MILLKDTNSSLTIVTSSTADIDYSINWVDITTSGASASSSEGKITTATTTTIVAVPGSSTQRQIKSITISNIHASTSNTVTINKVISGTTYRQIIVILQAQEIIHFMDGLGWGNPEPIVATTLTADVHTDYSDYQAISDPSAPSANVLRIYARNVSGRMLPKWKGPSGLDIISQPALFGNNIVMWNPGATSGVAYGTVTTAIAAGVVSLPTTTSQYTAMRKNTFTVATGVNLMNSVRTEAMFFRGASGTQGGFFFFCRFGTHVWTAGNRAFIGLSVDTTALLTANPSSKLNLIGFGIDSGDTAFTFMHNDGSGSAVRDAISGQPSLASNQGYDVFIFCKPVDSTVYWRINNINAGTLINEGSATSELPVNTTMMTAVAAIGSGSNAGAAAAVLGLNRIYIETDY